MKKFLNKYWVFLVIGVMVLLIIIFVVILRPNPNRQLIKELKKDITDSQNEIRNSNKKIERLRSDSIASRRALAEREKSFEDYVRKNDEAFEKLKKSKPKVNLRNASDAKLDSIRTVLLSN